MNFWTHVVDIWSALKQDCKNFHLQSMQTLIALKTAIACTLAILIAWLLFIDNPFWAPISALVVTLSSTGASFDRGLTRALSTMLGALGGLIVSNLFGSDPGPFALAVFLTTACSLYFAYKVDNLYACILGIATFIMVSINMFNAPGEAVTTAYYRATEVVIGVLCSWMTNLVIFPTLALPTYRINSKKVLDLFRAQYDAFILAYQTGQTNQSTFLQDHNQLLRLLQSNQDLQKFVNQERLFGILKAKVAENFAICIRSAAEILFEAYTQYKAEHADFSQLFIIELQELLNTSSYSFIELHHYIDHHDNESTLLAAVKLWQQAITKLITKYNQYREQGTSYQHKVQSIIQWQVFITTQQDLCQLFLAIKENKFKQKFQIPWKIRLANLGHYDRYFWHYGLKCALFILLILLIAMNLNIPEPGQIAISIIAVAQLDATASKKKGILRALGCCFGAIISVIFLGLNITNFWVYLCGMGFITFLLAYIHHSNNLISYLGTQAAVAFFIGTVEGTGPVNVLAPVIERLMAIIIGVIAIIVILNWIWPFRREQVFDHTIRQIVRFSCLIQHQLLIIAKNSGDHESYYPLVQKELTRLRNNILALESNFEDSPSLSELARRLYPLCKEQYHTLVSLMLCWPLQNKLTQNEQKHIADMSRQIFRERVCVNELQAMVEAIDTYISQTREKAHHGYLMPVNDLLIIMRTMRLLRRFSIIHIDLYSQLEQMRSKLNNEMPLAMKG